MSVHIDVVQRLKEAGLSPRKRLGQNFLVDPVALQRIVEAASLARDEAVIEIGSGPGTLTRALAAEAHHLVAVEIDPNMVEILRTTMVGADHVRIVQGDILSLPIQNLLDIMGLQPNQPYKVVGNLPYYITSAILRHLLEADHKPVCVIVTVQEEVARRVVAQPGDMSLLAVSVQYYGRPAIVARIPAGAFYPVPKVDSAVVRIDLAKGPTVDVEDVTWFFSVVRAGFSARRKQLHNALTHSLGLSGDAVRAGLERAVVDSTRRAQTLTLSEWARLSRALQEENTSSDRPAEARPRS